MRTRRWVIGGCVGLFLASCRTAPPAGDAKEPAGRTDKVAAPNPAPVREGPIEVSLRVEAVTKSGQGFVESGKTLRTGDQIALHVGISEAAYVYVGHSAPTGAQTILYPTSGNELFAPGTERRIPAPGQWLRLDKEIGREDVFVYASRTPLSADEVLSRLKQDRARSQAAAAPAKTSAATTRPATKRPARRPSEDAPELLSANTRGLDLVDDKGADIQTDRGVTRAHFEINHAK